MAAFILKWHEAVKKDIKKLKLSKKQIISLTEKAKRIAENPLPKAKGGYGEPLADDLRGYLKFRFDGDYRVCYKLEEVEGLMVVIIVGLRKDSTVYKELSKRKLEES